MRARRCSTPRQPERDEVDEEREVVDACVPLGEQVALDPLEPADQLVHQAADLGEVAADRADLRAQPVLQRVADAARQRRLELGRGGGERLDLLARPLERRVELRRLDRPEAAWSMRACARLIASGSIAGEATARIGQPGTDTIANACIGHPVRQSVSTLGSRDDYRGCDGRRRAGLRAAARADRAAAGGAARRVAAARRTSGRPARAAPPFAELPDELHGELVVVNDTRVVPARIPIDTPRGEVLLLERIDGDVWEGLARPTRRLKPGTRYGPVELLEHLGEGRWRLRLDGEPHGETPLPPYITAPLADPERYQTVYARDAGSAAAPTAGLHFTPELLAALDVERVTLHVGLDTFRPVNEATLEEHVIHGERYDVAPDAWQRIERGRARARRRHDDGARARDARTRRAARRPHRALHHAGLRVPPRRRAPDELPPAALDAARARDGVRRRRARSRRLYALAVEERYRFYSFGDAMLIL